ncbi:hypothetical protein CC78DRAFT_345680 [Lojkania enalia]|uniref:Uncharacterized protein n=1 Tax=Lojkania enalia TaxID=147567 RepID=A0A9P4K5I3_9PLEO|nr:hypothetical protein CC78DRAFT_345680 [Didymosphaeria enalia]
MVKRHIVPIPATQDGGPVVVVEVIQNGSQPLDVQLVGCEGENPYVATIKQQNVGKLRHNNFKGSDAEWLALLSHFLLQIQPEERHASALERVRTEYSWRNKDLVITFRQDVENIKVTLGDIVLPQDLEYEISPFEWAQISAQAHAQALEEMASLKAELKSKQGIIDKLNAQLEDFIKTKNVTETAMLQQFMELLNEKKRKIRDQQRLLAGAKIEKSTASAVQSTREETRPRKAGPSRASKRKTPVRATVAEQESDSDQMEIDKSKEEEQEELDDNSREATPDRTTDDETEDENEAPARSAPRLRDRSSETDDATATVAQASKDVPKRGEPPRRELPFARPNTRGKPAAKQPSPPTADDDETDDDEL